MSNFSLFCCCLILFISDLHAVLGNELIVEPTWPSCDNYTTSIQNNGRSTFINNITSNNTVFKLKPGCHYIDSFVPIQDQFNVTIEGIGESTSDVVIFCRQNTVGLVFLGMRGLTLQNLSISNCGLTGDHLNQTIGVIEKDYMPNFQSIFTYNSSTLYIAVLLIESSDVTMTNVNMLNNIGYGLLAVNVRSSFVIESCKFSNNSNELYGPCFSSVDYGIGGGIFVLYQDSNIKRAAGDSSTQFSVSNTEFMYNANCQLDSTNFIFSSIVELSEQRLDSLPIGGGGGLTVYLANLLYPVEVNVRDCYFQNNTALAGGGILIGVFVGASNNTINIMDSMFYCNGLLLGLALIDRTLGGGLFILKDIPFPFSVSAIQPSGSITFTIQNCYFKENMATSMAGAGVFSLYLVSGFYFDPDEVRFNNCTFIENQAFATSALLLQEFKRNGFQPGTQFYLTDMTFFNNTVLTTHFMLSAKTTDQLNTLGVSGVTIVMNGTNKFINNDLGTPISSRNSILDISGELQIKGNSGNAGGALALIMSSIILNRDTHMLFLNNEAYLQAGAIFTYTANPIFDFDCYLFFGVIALQCHDFGSKSCPDPRQMNITIVFDNNIAPISNVAYGSTLYDCPWRQPLNDSCCGLLPNITDTYRLLQAADVFIFKQALNGDSLSTPPVRLTTNITSSKPVMLGQQVIVEVLSYDGFDQLVPDPISSVVYDDAVNGAQDSRLGNGSYWFVNRNKFHQVPVSVRSKDPVTKDDFNIGIYSITSTAGNRFDISITDCYPGFEFQSSNENTTDPQYKTCKCLEIFDRLGISCFEENATIIVPNGYWLGQIGDNWVYERCPFDYCKQGDKVIVNGQFDDQCNDGYHRRDVLCGRCDAHYSALLGTNKCDKCSLFLSVGSMVYYAFVGFFLISSIGRLGISVSYGYINSLIFFGNIAYQFLSIILLDSNSVFRVLLFYPIDVLNGGIGVQSCVFSGMTALYRNYIQFIFPIYLYIILGIHVIVIRYFTKSAQKWIANPAQVFATVILITYVSLLESSIYGLSFTYIDYQGVNGSTGGELTWSADSNVKYFSLEHAPLVIISLVFLFLYLLPSTILLLFPSLAFRTPIGKKLIPIYDAYWAPFKDQFKFWIGLRLILRIIPLVLAGYVPRPYNIFCLLIFIIAYTFAHIIVRPFVREVQNILDVYMNFCLLLLISGSSYRNSAFVDANDNESFIVFYNVLTICLIYFAIFLVIGHHFYMKVQCLQEAFDCMKYFGNRMHNKVRNNIIKINDHQSTTRQSMAESSYGEMTTTIDDDASGEFKGLKELYKNRTSSTSNTELREPLLDDEFIQRKYT